MSGSTKFVIDIFNSPDPHELTSLYHNITLQPLTGVVPEYLFARFAWPIFQFVPIFLQAGIPRRLTLYEPSTTVPDNDKATHTSIKTLREECRMLPFWTKSRSTSPRKRKPPEDEVHYYRDTRGSSIERRGRRMTCNYGRNEF